MLSSMQAQVNISERYLRQNQNYGTLYSNPHEPQKTCMLCQTTVAFSQPTCLRCGCPRFAVPVCTAATRLAKYFDSLERAGLWPSLDSHVSPMEYSNRIDKLRNDHDTCGGQKCPLTEAFERLRWACLETLRARQISWNLVSTGLPVPDPW